MNKFAQIQAFVELVDAGSATKAAERLGVATSAISRRVSELEARLGVQLLQRSTRSMHFTEAGAAFYQRCSGILSELSVAEQQASSMTAVLSGELRIAVPLSFGTAELASAVTDFMSLHPQMTIDLDMSDRRVNLVEDGFDLAIRIGELEDSNLVARKLTTVELILCASAEFLRKSGEPRTISELAMLPALIYSNVFKGQGKWSYRDPQGKAGVVQMKSRLKCSNGDALCQAAIAGIGVCCEPDFIVKQAIELQQLQPIMPGYQWPSMGVYAVYPSTKYLTSKARAFIDYLSERYATKTNV
ncbi:MAG: LysR family transcriptional regulator [Arenicella sp.]